MTRVTLIDGQTAGISGDMLLAALIDAGANVTEIQQILDVIPRHFHRCKEIKLTASEVKTHGFRSCRAELAIVEAHEETKAQELIQATNDVALSANLSERAKTFATNAIRILTEVESNLHGSPISSTHLHEAGSTDTLADILGTAAACDSISLFDGEIYSSPIAVGGGTVSFSHGTLSVPAPAVLEIARLHRIPIIQSSEGEELATPTGMSMLASLTNRFALHAVPIVPTRVGYGAGKKTLASSPNVLRVTVGETTKQPFSKDAVQVLETNLDDVSGEVVGSALQRILQAGARDAWITQAQFKKNRPGFTLHAICAREDLERLAKIMIRETGTLGVRYQEWERLVAQRDIIVVKVHVGEKAFEAKVKVAKDTAGEILRIKPEFDDVEAIAKMTRLPVAEVSSLVMDEAKKNLTDKRSD